MEKNKVIMNALTPKNDLKTSNSFTKSLSSSCSNTSNGQEKENQKIKTICSHCLTFVFECKNIESIDKDIEKRENRIKILIKWLKYIIELINGNRNDMTLYIILNRLYNSFTKDFTSFYDYMSGTNGISENLRNEFRTTYSEL